MVERVMVHERIEPLFATVCMVVVAPDRRSLRLSLAGHLPPLLLTPGDGHLLSGERLGVPLGVVEGTKWEALDVPLEPGWSLLLYTDGVFEGRVGAGSERLGHERMAAIVLEIQHQAGLAGTDLLDELIARAERLNSGPLDDDVALALLSHHPGEPAR
jgi:serine phosphatase RsbU (regulator of sigma subunit)